MPKEFMYGLFCVHKYFEHDGKSHINFHMELNNDDGNGFPESNNHLVQSFYINSILLRILSFSSTRMIQDMNQ